jgi:hypothetical protein
MGAAGVCSIDHWCWESPRPQGGWLRDVFAVATDDVWMAGDRGQIIHWDGTDWTGHGRAEPVDFRKIYAADANKIWAVGASALPGAAYKPSIWGYDGNTWTDYPVSGSRGLESVHGTGPNDVWAVGGLGQVYHWDGATWSDVDFGVSNYVFDVHALAADNVWIAGRRRIHQWDGTEWHEHYRKTTPGSGDFRHLWVRAPDDIWFAGLGLIAHWDGQAITEIDIPGVSMLTALPIWGDGDEVWFGSYKYKAESVTQHAVTGDMSFTAIDGVADNDLWSVSPYGTIHHWDGAAWEAITTAPSDYDGKERPQYLAIDGVGGKVWALGQLGSGAHFDGTEWSSIENPIAPYASTGIWARAADDVWAVGDRVFRWDGTQWNAFADIAGNSIWGASETDVWVINSGGRSFHYDGTTWSESILPSAPYYDVWGSSTNDVWVVGLRGIAHWNGTSWSEALKTDLPLRGIWGSGANDVWAAGENGLIMHFDGNTWTEVENDDVINFRAVHGVSADEVYFATAGNSVYRWNGSNVTKEHAGLNFGNDIFASQPDSVWVVGPNWSILRRHP